MVSRDDIDRDAAVRDLFEGRKGHIHQAGRDAAAEKEIPPMHNRIHLPPKSRLQGSVEIHEKILSHGAIR